MAEHLVATTYGADRRVLAGVLSGRPEFATRPIDLYARAVPDHPALADALVGVLDEALGRLCDLAIDQAAAEKDREVILGDSTVAATLVRWITVTSVGIEMLADAAARIPPRSDVVLNALALALTAQLADRHRSLAAANPAAYEPALAVSLNNLSVRLGDAGRRDEGLAALEEAVAVYRRLATADPAAHEPALAVSLNNLSVRLGDAGRRDEAALTRFEAAAIENQLQFQHGDNNPPAESD